MWQVYTRGTRFDEMLVIFTLIYQFIINWVQSDWSSRYQLNIVIKEGNSKVS